YLQAMINEEILAQLPEVKTLNTKTIVRKPMRLLQQELLVEKLFNVEVSEKVTVSEDEIRDAINKSSFENKVKYIYTDDSKEALVFKKALKEGTNYDSLLAGKLGRLGLNPEYGETDYIAYGELHEPFNETIFSLGLNEVSPMIAHGKGYYIIKKIDSRRTIISEMDYAKYRHRYDQIIRYKKDRIQTGKFLTEFMDPKELVVDGKIFRELANTIYPITTQSQVDSGLTQTPNGSDVSPFRQISDRLSDYYDVPIVRFRGGNWTVRELLYHLSYRPLDLRSTSTEDFAGKLRKIIGLTVRDVFMEEEALRRDYDRDPQIRYELDRWERKYSTRVFMDSIKSQCVPDPAEVESLFNNSAYAPNINLNQVEVYLTNLLIMKKTQDQLMELIKASGIEVTLYPENIESVEVDEPRAGRLPDVKLYKLGLPYFREAFPTPDVLWSADEVLGNISPNFSLQN
ncbi:MAG: hypothetical protein KAU06_09160, partial [Candidatus Marinimicrobia bacterium]|nr:hypothetical protein [Candidatus Neomarinimicrobiota bacterium]